jgi:TPR repeat protein
MGVGYYYGTFVEQDKEKGMMLLKKACDCDCTDALNTIGMILNEEKRYDESFPYHKRSAEKGDMYGLHNLGNAYFYARGVERDVKKAFDLWTEAGDKGNPDSHFTIGNIFFRGEYVEQDIPLAIKCYEFAANHPCTTQRMAMEQLVKAYQMTGNEKEAQEWNAKLSEIE